MNKKNWGENQGAGAQLVQIGQILKILMSLTRTITCVTPSQAPGERHYKEKGKSFLLGILPLSLCRREAEFWLIHAGWRNFETRIWLGSVVVCNIFLFK